MKKHLLLCMMILGWAPTGCSSKTAEINSTRQPPARDALAHLCRHMAQGPSDTTMTRPAVERQTAWMAEMTEAATAANIARWPSFRSSLSAMDPRAKQAWLELGVETHGLQSECAVILKK